MRNQAAKDTSELEAVEQREWRESLDYVIQQGDRGRVQRLLASLRHQARMAGVALPFTAVTAYVNSIRPEDETPLPGSQEIERRIEGTAASLIACGHTHLPRVMQLADGRLLVSNDAGIFQQAADGKPGRAVEENVPDHGVTQGLRPAGQLSHRGTGGTAAAKSA